MKYNRLFFETAGMESIMSSNKRFWLLHRYTPPQYTIVRSIHNHWVLHIFSIVLSLQWNVIYYFTKLLVWNASWAPTLPWPDGNCCCHSWLLAWSLPPYSSHDVEGMSLFQHEIKSAGHRHNASSSLVVTSTAFLNLSFVYDNRLGVFRHARSPWVAQNATDFVLVFLPSYKQTW